MQGRKPVVWEGPARPANGVQAAPGNAAVANGKPRSTGWVQQDEDEDLEFDEVAQESGDDEGEEQYEDEYEQYDEGEEQQYEDQQYEHQHYDGPYEDGDGQYDEHEKGEDGAEEEHEQQEEEQDEMEEQALLGPNGGRLVASVNPATKFMVRNVVTHVAKGNEYKIVKGVQASGEQAMRHHARLAARAPLQHAFAKDMAANVGREVEQFDNVRRVAKAAADRQRALVFSSICIEVGALLGFRPRPQVDGVQPQEEGQQNGEDEQPAATRLLDDFDDFDFVTEAMTAHRPAVAQARVRKAPTPRPRAPKPALDSNRLLAPLFAPLGVNGAAGARPSTVQAARMQRKRPAAAAAAAAGGAAAQGVDADADATGATATGTAAQDIADILGEAAGEVSGLPPAKRQRQVAAGLERSHSAPPVAAAAAEGDVEAKSAAAKTVFSRLSGIGSGGSGGGSTKGFVPLAAKRAAGAKANGAAKPSPACKAAPAAAAAAATAANSPVGTSGASSAEPAAAKPPQQQRQRQRPSTQAEEATAGPSSSKAAAAAATDTPAAAAVNSTANGTKQAPAGAASTAKGAVVPKRGPILYVPPGSRATEQQDEQQDPVVSQPARFEPDAAPSAAAKRAPTIAAIAAGTSSVSAAQAGAKGSAKHGKSSSNGDTAPAATADAAAATGVSAAAAKPRLASKAAAVTPTGRVSVHSRLGTQSNATAAGTNGTNGSNGHADSNGDAKPGKVSVLQRLGGEASADAEAEAGPSAKPAPAARKAAGAAAGNGTSSSRPSVLNRLGSAKSTGAAAADGAAGGNGQSGDEAYTRPVSQKRRASEGGATERRSGVFGAALLSAGMSGKKQRLSGGGGTGTD